MFIVNIREYKLQSQPMLKQFLPSGVPGFSLEGAFQALKFGVPPTLFIKPHYCPPRGGFRFSSPMLKRHLLKVKRCFRGSLQGGASFKVEKAHFAAWERVREKYSKKCELCVPPPETFNAKAALRHTLTEKRILRATFVVRKCGSNKVEGFPKEPPPILKIPTPPPQNDYQNDLIKILFGERLGALTLGRHGPWKLALPKRENPQKWLGEGAKGLLGPGSKSRPRVFFLHHPNSPCTGAEWGCTGARGVSLGGSKTLVAASLNHFGGFSLFGQFPTSVAFQLQQFPSVTSIGSLPPKNLGKSRGPPQNPAETPQNPRRDPAEPSERTPQSPLRGKFPQRASRRVVPLGW